jgi:hypothetical protein
MTINAQAGVAEGTGCRPCGHSHHIGTCTHCQRAQLARWRRQLIEVSEARAYQRYGFAALSSSAAMSMPGPRA